MLTANMYLFYNANSSDYLRKVKTISDLTVVKNLFNDTVVLNTLDYEFSINTLNSILGRQCNITLFNANIEKPYNIVLVFVEDGKEGFIVYNGWVNKFHTTNTYPTNEINLTMGEYSIDNSTMIDKNTNTYGYESEVIVADINNPTKVEEISTPYSHKLFTDIVKKGDTLEQNNILEQMKEALIVRTNFAKTPKVILPNPYFKPPTEAEAEEYSKLIGQNVTLMEFTNLIGGRIFRSTVENGVIIPNILNRLKLAKMLKYCMVLTQEEEEFTANIFKEVLNGLEDGDYTLNIDHTKDVPIQLGLKSLNIQTVENTRQFTIINQVENFTSTSTTDQQENTLINRLTSEGNTIDIEILPKTTDNGEFPYLISDTFKVMSEVKNKPVTCTITNDSIVYSTTNGWKWIINTYVGYVE